jgi:superfamily II DNA/RNA helicase
VRLADFARGAVRVLVATDLAARGIDTAHVAHVIQAEMAGDAVTHLHRVGRAGRAGGGAAAGAATALVERRSLPLVRMLIEAEERGEAVDRAISHRRSLRRAERRRGEAIASAAAAEAEGEAEAAALARELKEWQVEAEAEAEVMGDAEVASGGVAAHR